MKKLIADITCVKSTNGTSIDVFLTNESTCIHHTASFKTTVSNCHKLILIFFKTYFKKLLQKILNKGTVKTLTKIFFLRTQELSKRCIYMEKYHQHDVFTNIFRMALDVMKHLLLQRN